MTQSNECQHKQLARQCPLCEKNQDIKDAFLEGYRVGYSTGINEYLDDEEEAWDESQAKKEASV